jgi:hypothetical protein
MKLAQRLIEQPQREKGGSIAQERFDYQALWGLALIFSNHATDEDYAVAFEFHDDVLLLDSASDPAKIRFYQVKTKSKGHWTLADLFRRPPLKKGEEEKGQPLSFMGKLFSGYSAFPEETAEMSFVSNLPLEFHSSNAIAFKNCDAKIFAKFLEKLKLEHKDASDEQASLMYFVKADLSLEDSATHIKGKLNDFVVKALGEISYNLESLYRAVVEDCRTRSKFTGEIKSFEELIRYKAVTRADVDKWLAPLSLQSAMPEWPEIASELSGSPVQITQLRTEWMKYRAQALDAGNEAIRTVRRAIRAALHPIIENGLSLDEYMAAASLLVKPLAMQHLTPYSDNKLRVMILYEVMSYATTGQFQDVDPQSPDKAA